ncbi:hypothetical protein M409DRAFT_30988 [Zasmidium cellare ATCC 36951]|uniref:Major facilitator superfamily (MFS) profile domain-containing protein n=1 Tax=Zasmidium cellare ATCC 36951 TaxID=1080233 RepID=A0A6A6BX48_ZASCE|nr:uncharacterized protein M409DRAFT_30988 [Zasmidium cellare ATCC 36951]KAF2158520.1 hypothetical protein M409DRAFT_30988 [Zasmidium cellare ATCC 36951]
MPSLLNLRGHRLAVVRIALVVLPAFLLFGYNQSSTGGILGYPPFVHTFPEIDTVDAKGGNKVHKATIQGTVVAIYTIGCLFGALFAVPLGNRYGRRRALAVHAVVGIIGQTLQASSFSLAQLIVGRIVTGLGVGGINALVPVWQSECTKPKSRGRNVVVIGIFVATGQAMASWVNYGLGVIPHSQVAWRLPLAIPIIFILMLLASVFFFPESPVWLAQKGRINEATHVYAILDDMADDSDELRIKATAVFDSFEIHRQRTVKGWARILSKRQEEEFYRACLAFAVNFNAQMTGANGVTYYANTIFTESLHFATREAAVLSASLLSWKILVCLIPLMIVDRYGRKPLFIISGSGMSLAMVSLAATVSQLDHSVGSGRAAVFFLFLYMTFFPVGYLGANFLYATEIGVSELRVHFSAIGTATHWLFNFVIAEIIPTCFASIGYQTYIIFAVISAATVPLVLFIFPETKGRSLEQIDEIFFSADKWYKVTRDFKRSSPQDMESSGTADGKIERVHASPDEKEAEDTEEIEDMSTN